jgi:hypothetical protein
MRFRLAALCAPLALLALPATADEVWSTSFGDIVYQSSDPEGSAIFTAPGVLFDGVAPKGSVAHIYIPYLDSVPDSRYAHTGFWILEGEGQCPVGLVGPDGKTSRNWGQVELLFDSPTFPSGFTMSYGTCEFSLSQFVRAEPVLGE